MSGSHDSPSAATTPGEPSEDELRAAYEAELNRITSTDMILQTTVSLLNIGGRRLGLSAGAGDDRDLDQVSDAIDGARALMPILERRMPSELGPMRDALAQLQMAYAREVKTAREPSVAAPAPAPAPAAAAPAGSAGESPSPGAGAPAPGEGEKKPAPGPAESSGRLWVPGR